MKQFLSLQFLLLAILVDTASATDLGIDGVLDSRISLGNSSGIVLQSPKSLFMTLDKRQQCAAGYGTCPGGVTCGCSASDNCCGSICKYRTQVCCTNWICEANEFCCGGTLHPKSCRPAGTECCFDGTYCLSGTYCIKYDNENFARCRVIGSVSEPPPRSTTYATTAPVPSSTTSTYVPVQVTTTTRYYTITYTVYWYYYFYYSFTTYYAPSTFTLSSVRSSYTSSPTLLSAYATGSADASRSLSNDASAIESSLSRSALSTSSSMSSVCSAASSSYSSRIRLLSTASSTTSSSSGSSTGSSSGSNSGGGVTQNTSVASSLTNGHCVVLFAYGTFVALTGILMIVL